MYTRVIIVQSKQIGPPTSFYEDENDDDDYYDDNTSNNTADEWDIQRSLDCLCLST